MVEKAEEMIGCEDVYFKVDIKSARGLPDDLNCNAYVVYNMKYEKNAQYMTGENTGLNSRPVWNHSQVHHINEITE